MTGSFPLSLIVGTFVGGAAGFLGSLMVTRRMALVGDALGHVALPGMGLALLFKLDPSLGALASLAIGILLVWYLGEITYLSIETLVGIVFVSSLALGFLVVPQPELLETLIGDISKVSAAGAAVSVLCSLAILAVAGRIYPGMMLLNISPELAAVEGVKTRRYNLIYLSAVALIVAVGVKVTGSLLVGALVIVPPATARVVSSRLGQYARLSVVFGAGSGFVGILASEATRFPAGPAIILVSALAFALSLAFKRVRAA